MNLSTCKPFFNEVHNLVNTEDNYLTAQINFACTVYQFKYKVFIDRNIIYSKKKKSPNFCLMFGHIYFRAVYHIFKTLCNLCITREVWGLEVLPSKYKTSQMCIFPMTPYI